MAAGAHPGSILRRALATTAVAGALSLAACGDSPRDTAASAGPACARASKVAFQQPTIRHTFRVAGASRAQLDETVRVLCWRIAGSDTAHRVTTAGADRVTVELPASSRLAREGAASTVFGSGRLAFYDWEANVVGRDGKPAPRDPAVTGGVDGQAGALTRYEAIVRASRRPALAEADNAAAASRWYAVDATAQKVVSAVAAPTREQALEAVPAAQRATAKVYEVKPDTVIVDAGERIGIADRWYVLRDDVALRGSDIACPRPGAGPRGEPAVLFEHTPAGRRAWQELAGTLVGRGSRSASPEGPVEQGFQHFAVVLDDRVVMLAFLDHRVHPEGLDPRAGSMIEGGLTIASARELAALIGSGQLPRPLQLVASG